MWGSFAIIRLTSRGKKWGNGAHAQGKDQEGKAIKWMCDNSNSTWCNIW